jgi:hypothetical protein
LNPVSLVCLVLQAKTLESYLKLQDEHSRVIRAAQLAQQVSRAQVGRVGAICSGLHADKKAGAHAPYQNVVSPAAEFQFEVRCVSFVVQSHEHLVNTC